MKTPKQNFPLLGYAALKPLVLFAVCAICFAACSKDPDAPKKVEVESTEYIVPTEDVVAVKSTFTAYISPKVATEAFGGALRLRLINQNPSYDIEIVDNLITLVIHNSDIEQMSQNEDLLASLFAQLLLGRNIVIVEPTMEGFDDFCTTLTSAYDLFLEDAEGREMLEEFEQEAVPGARQVFEVLHETSEDDSKIASLFALESDANGVLAEAIAIRGCTFHVVERLLSYAETSEITHEYLDEEGNYQPIEECEVGENPDIASNIKISAYSYGVVADMLTAWINDHEYYYDEYEMARKRSLLDVKSTTETSKLSLEDIANVQKVEYTINASSPYDVSPKLPVLIRFEVCSVYMEKEDCDYYCIYKNIRSYNQVLECGPYESKEWKRHKNYGYYIDDPSLRYPIWEMLPFYGPFMRDISGKSICYAASEQITNTADKATDMLDGSQIKMLSNVRVEDYAPKNSAGSMDISTGVSLGLDGGLSFGAETSFSIGGSVSYDKSTTQTIQDLEIKASSSAGLPIWDYIGHNLPQSHTGLFNNSHDIAPNIMRDECEVDQSWIWRVSNPTGSYCLYDETTITTCMLGFSDYLFYSKDIYTNAETCKRVSFLMLPPPRCEQIWIRDVHPYSEEVNQLLGTLHSKYWNSGSYELTIPDSSEESTLSIHQFCNAFRQDLQDKRMIWHNRDLVPDENKYTFTFYKKGSSTEVKMVFEL